jgi:hypothetical protein
MFVPAILLSGLIFVARIMPGREPAPVPQAGSSAA